MFELKVDYHIHSTYSDGKMSPVDIVKKYKADEYDEIAITDHDTINGLNEAMIAAKAIELKVIPGIELSATYKGNVIHILGFKFDVNNLNLKNKLKELKNNWDLRTTKICELLNERGYNISIDEVFNVPEGYYIGTPNIASCLVNNGYFKNNKEAIDYLKNDEKISSIKKEKIDYIEAIKLINDANGMACLAHPKKYTFLGEPDTESFYNEIDKMLKDLKKVGLKGLECIYPTHSLDDEYKFIELAQKNHLHITKGSDFHGEK